MKSLNFVRCSAEYSGINSMAAMPPANTEKSAKRSTAPAHPAKGAAVGHQQHQEIQHQENTYHDGNIVIGQDAQRKADAVQPVFPFSHQLFKPQGYQGEQENTIQPHHVPVIGRQIAGHGIKNGKGNHGRASGFKAG